MADDETDSDNEDSEKDTETEDGEEIVVIEDTAYEVENTNQAQYREEYDFAIYEDAEAEKVQLIESLHKINRPRVSGLVSRFNIGIQELDRIANINNLVSELTIKVASYPNDINILKKFYGTLYEFWENIRNIYGSIINYEVNEIKGECRKLLKQYANERVVPDRVHNNLLFLATTLMRLKYLAKFGYETDKAYKSIFTKAKGMIVG